MNFLHRCYLPIPYVSKADKNVANFALQRMKKKKKHHFNPALRYGKPYLWPVTNIVQDIVDIDNPKSMILLVIMILQLKYIRMTPYFPILVRFRSVNNASSVRYRTTCTQISDYHQISPMSIFISDVKRPGNPKPVPTYLCEAFKKKRF